MDLDLGPVRYFVAVAEELHFGRAATRLYVSQPALSRQIRKLEADLGEALLVRDSRHVTLTARGEQFLLDGRRLLTVAERMTSPQERDVVRLAHVFELMTSRQVADAFAADHPDIQVVERSMNSAHQLDALLSRRLGVAILRMTRQMVRDHPVGWHRRLLRLEPLRLVGRPTDTPGTVASLRERPVTVFADTLSSGMYNVHGDYMSAFERDTGIDLGWLGNPGTFNNCLAAVMRAAEPALLLDFASHTDRHAEVGLPVYRPLEHEPVYLWSIAWREEPTAEPVADVVRTALALSASRGWTMPIRKPHRGGCLRTTGASSCSDPRGPGRPGRSGRIGTRFICRATLICSVGSGPHPPPWKAPLMTITPLVWGVTIAIIIALLAIDLIVAAVKPHRVGFKEATAWSIFYIAVAVGFGVWFTFSYGGELGTQYFAGYLVEKSLSVDNLFVFVIIMTTFAVPEKHQHKVLTFGIVLALIMRAIFIALGATLLSLFSVVFLLFGLLLIFTAIQLFRHRDEDPDIEDNVVVKGARRLLPVTDDYVEGKLTTRIDGRRMVTPLFLVLIAIGSIDLLFALDSIPAVFGVTKEPFIVFTANAFALLGLRALFFLVQGLLDRLVYLSTGLSLILAFIGVKLILHWLHVDINPAVPEIPTLVSLGVILVVLAITTVASLIKTRNDPAAKAHAGSIRAHKPKPSEGSDTRR